MAEESNSANILPDEESISSRILHLSEQASTCTACGLASSRTTVVFGDGNPETPLVFVGEGPGQNEDATGLPFVGRSGVLLDECMRENSITRKHVYICNVIRCRACTRDSFTGRLANRQPTPDETKACSPWLIQTLDTIRPLIIVCLGAPAANAIIHSGFRMRDERGQWFESRYAPYAIATYHPAYILRMEGAEFQAARQTLIEDIAAARRQVKEARKAARTSLF